MLEASWAKDGRIARAARQGASAWSAATRRNDVADGWWQITAIVVIFALASFFLATTYFVLGGALGRLSSVAISLISLGVAVAGASAFGLKGLTRSTLVVLVVYALAVLACDRVVDVTYDGQDYHFTAIWALANGWNSYHADFGDFIAPASDHEMWAPLFPKAAWVPGALQAAMGLNYEAAKSQTIMLTLAAFAATVGCALTFGVRRWKALVLAALLVANPITITEMFARMVDGVMGNLFAIFLLTMVTGVVRRDWRLLGLGLVTLAFTVNVKASGIVILAVFCAALCVMALIWWGWRSTFRYAAVLLATALLSIFVLGCDPYLKNLVNHGHPLYPMRGGGANAIPIDDEFRPPALKNHSDPVRLALSLAAETRYDGPVYKLPFAFTHDELVDAGDPEVFLAGFGPWFSGVLAVAMVIIVAAGVARRPASMKSLGGTLAICGVGLLVSSFIMPESWAVRYVPQLWLVPVAAMAFAMETRGLRWLGVLCAVALLGNVLMVAGSTAHRLGTTSTAIAAQVARLKQRPPGLCVDVGSSPARLSYLEQRGLRMSIRQAPAPANCSGLEPLPGAYEYDPTGPLRPANVCGCPG